MSRVLITPLANSSRKRSRSGRNWPRLQNSTRQTVSDLQQAVVEVKTVVEGLDDIPGYTVTKKEMKKSWDRGWKWIIEKPENRAEGNQEGRETESRATDREEACHVRERVW